MRPLRNACLIAVLLALAGCATAGTVLTAQGTLAAAGFTVEAYCALTPEARAEFRRKLGVRVAIFDCGP